MSEFAELTAVELESVNGGAIPVLVAAILIGAGGLAAGFGAGYGLAVWLG